MSTPTGLKSLIDQVAGAAGAYVYGSDPSSIALGSAASPVKVYVDGDFTLNGNPDGYGVLVVTGKLTYDGKFRWHGIILVVGDGEMEYGGGGNPEINTGRCSLRRSGTTTRPRTCWPSLGSPSIELERRRRQRHLLRPLLCREHDSDRSLYSAARARSRSRFSARGR